MACLGFCGEWFLSTCSSKLIAIHTKEPREPFVFDCSRAEKRLKIAKDVNSSDASEDTGSDTVLAFAVSSSGKLMAITDDTKRLILFQCEPSWHCISIRWVIRRCTSLVFSPAEDELLVADKSGDVYSFSVVEPEKDGELKMGHLSMLLAVTISADDQYIITADRDEKIRVSHRRSPYNIQSYCLGHHQFVSTLEIPKGHPHWLLSGSGDGTVKLWEFESGRKLQSWDLGQLEDKLCSDTAKGNNTAVFRICSSPGGRDVAVLCDGLMNVYIFTLEQTNDEKLRLHSKLHLFHRPMDIGFDMKGQLWVLLDSSDVPLQIHTYRKNSWECDTENDNLRRVTDILRTQWSTTDNFTSVTNHFEHLYKVSFDNVSVYLQKKQQRIEEHQLKRTKGQKTKCTKKSKKKPDEVLTQPST
ncbi:tRNA (guanine-N(7)-)-methyltransferase non-catalytic subunit wdr4 isoform X2 [Xiphophorus couchianus]|uniref:tRNA (guanine-N(7)-)-methyltransferase non-catalytic subunit wdr4 isoform X2 n=1 Tax=Xiphophorus couchianus TaxID=32473 RepID=UPI0010167EA2|nr:tRNA (guanine-N(7)-)-methyltransferase non-catalytic subunit WDR4 isoform X2 [Xiphophorus couchianus]